jgi:hypothetical protein
VNLRYVYFFAAAIPAVSDIGSGGGSASLGSMTKYASIGSAFATGNDFLAVDENKSGLLAQKLH